MRELTTTSYAILGLLAVKPWSAYELTKQVKRSMSIYWPRAERGIYDEPQKLVSHGLATARKQTTGKRARTVYTITAKGRRALARWLEQPVTPPQFESEAMVRALFADHGTKEDLLAAIRSVRDHAGDLRSQAEDVIGGYVEGRGPFPERLHVIALTGRFNTAYIAMLDHWAAWAENVVDGWTDTSRTGSGDAMDIMLAALADLSGPVGTATAAPGDDDDRRGARRRLSATARRPGN